MAETYFPTRTPIGCYPKADRDLIGIADMLLTAIVRIELMASDPESNEMLVAYFDRCAGSEGEPWREHLLSLIRSMRDNGESN